jgi:hypothetical protein
MSLSIKTGVSPTSLGLSRASNPLSLPPSSVKIGKVYGIITTKNTPTLNQFEKWGGYGEMGSILFLDYNNAKNIDGDNSDIFLLTCDIAKPLFPNIKHYPLKGELVYILEGLPSPATQISSNSSQKYYVTVVNLWNDVQLNAQTNSNKAPLGKTFVESKSIRNLLSFEGDYIIQGRKGNSIRFSTTVRALGDKNEWSEVGDGGYPITIISNGHSYDENKEYYIEQINKDSASIYLTTNQSIPLKVDVKDPINPLTSPLGVPLYVNSQVVMNADRIVLNSKKDEVMLFASTNIEISTNNIINLNAGGTIHLNIKESDPSKTLLPSPKILLGTKFDNKPPTEPVMLGNQTSDFLLGLLNAIDQFAISLTATSTNQQGSPLAKIQGAAEALQTTLKPYYDKIQKLSSKSTYTI